MYDDVCQALGVAGAANYGSLEHRKQVLRMIADASIVRVVGPITQLKQFLPWVSAMIAMLPHWHMLLLGKSYIMVNSQLCDFHSLAIFGADPPTVEDSPLGEV